MQDTLKERVREILDEFARNLANSNKDAISRKISTLLEQERKEERNRVIGLIEEQMMSIGEGNEIMSDYMDVVSNERLKNVLKALTNKDN